MALNRIRLGDYITRSTTNNRSLQYGMDLITGVTSEGVFANPKGDPIEVDLKPYKIVNNGAFVYNPTRIDLGSIAYRTEGLCIVSHLYIVFYLNEKGKKIIDPIWLYIYFRRDEFRREVRFRNFGSQRPEFSFNDMSDIEIPLPDITIQRKYVAIYKAMIANQQSYERGLEDLKLVCDGYIEDLRRKMPCEKISKYLELVEDKNENEQFGLDSVRGVSIEKAFIETKADMTDVNLAPYYIIHPNDFAYVTVTSRNGEKISVALNDSDETYICSSSYVVFRSKDPERLFPPYLMLFFSRSEFNRYARFHSLGSARETFDWAEMCEVEIPIPDIKSQKAVAAMFSVYTDRKKINAQLKAQIKDICPILIKGSIEEGEKV